MRICWLPGLLLYVALASGARAQAQTEASPAQVAAARSDALENLKKEILSTPLVGDATVQTLVDKAGGNGLLNKSLDLAHQVGGPRWLDDQTAQVRLELNGGPVADALVEMAQSKPKALSIPPQALRDRLKRWKHRTFSAIGTSTASSSLDRLRPDPTQVSWQSVGDQDRRRAIDTAKQNAAQRVIDSLKPITWDGQRSLADVLAVPQVNDAIRKWLASRPVTSVEFRDNLEIRLTLAAAPQDLWPALKTAIEQQKAVPAPAGPADWDQLRQQVISRMAVASGVGTAVPGAAAARPTIAIPKEPPTWVDDALQADGSASSSQSLLRAAMGAKAVAQQQLRIKLNALSLSPGLTLGEAARQDPRIEEALARGIAHAQTARVVYDAPKRGSATARLTLNLDDVWRELSRLSE